MPLAVQNRHLVLIFVRGVAITIVWIGMLLGLYTVLK